MKTLFQKLFQTGNYVFLPSLRYSYYQIEAKDALQKPKEPDGVYLSLNTKRKG